MPCSNAKETFKKNRLLFSIIAGVIIGCIIGITSHNGVQSSDSPSPKRLVMYIKFPGELFIRMLKMIVIPLIVSSIIVALADIDISSAGSLGKRTMIYYLCTTLFSSVLGLILGFLIKPGSGVNEKGSGTGGKTPHRESLDNFLDLVRNAFPDNIVEAFLKSVYTTYSETGANYRIEAKNFTSLNMTVEETAKFIKDNLIVPISPSPNAVNVIVSDVIHDFGGTLKGGGTNMIGLIVFSIAFGVVLNMIKEEGRPLVNVCKSLLSASMKLVEIMMWTAPVGIASVIAGNIVETEDVGTLFQAIGMYALANVLGYIIQGGIFYPTLYFIFFRRSPLQHIKHVMPALMTAIGTSSSAATLPTTIECCESGAKIDKRVTRFVLPIGATCNMDGTALYYAITVLFIAQMEPDVNLGFGETILTVFVCTIVSIGAAGMANPGLTNTIIVLEAVGLPIGKLGPVFAVDWFVDRLQTSVNVMGDTYAAAFVEKMSQKELNNNGDEDLEMNGDKPTSTEGFTPSLSLLEDEKDEHSDLNTTL